MPRGQTLCWRKFLARGEVMLHNGRRPWSIYRARGGVDIQRVVEVSTQKGVSFKITRVSPLSRGRPKFFPGTRTNPVFNLPGRKPPRRLGDIVSGQAGAQKNAAD